MLQKTINLYRNAYSGLPRRVWFLAIIMLINRSGAMVIPFLTVYLTHSLKFGVEEAGWVLSSFGIGSIVGAYLGGQLVNRWGHYWLQLGSLILNGFLFLLLMHLRNIYSFAICIFVLSVVADAFRPANFNAIAHYTPTEMRARAYALNRLAMNLGFSVGPVLGGILAYFSYEWLFWADGLTCIFAGLMFWFLIKNEGQVIDNEPITKDVSVNQSPYRDRWYLFFIAFTALNATCFFQFFQTLPIYLKSQQDWSEYSIGFLLALNGAIVVLVEMVIVYQLQAYANKIRLIAGGSLLVGISFGILNLGNFAFLAWFTVILVSFGEIFTMPFMNAVVVERSNAQNRGQYSALYTIAYSIAHIFSPILGTQVIAHFGYTTLWYLIPVLCTLSCLGFKWLETETKPREWAVKV